MKLLAVVAHAWLYACAVMAQNLGPLGVFTPIAEFDSTIQATGGQTATARTIEIECSNALTGGQLLVGDYYVDIDCIPPRYTYYYDPVGNIPRAMQLMIDEVCLTDDEAGFYAAGGNPSLSTLQRISNSNPTTAMGIQAVNAARKLLQLDPVDDALAATAVAEASDALATSYVALGLSVAAIAVSAVAMSTANAAMNKVNYVQGEVDNIAGTLGLMQQWQQNQTALNNATQQQIANIDTALAAQVATNTQLELGINNTLLAIDALRNSTTQALNQLQTNINTGLNQVESQLSAESSQLQGQIFQLWWSMGNTTAQTYSEIQDLYSEITSTNSMVAGVTSITWDLIHQRQLRNLLNAGFWSHADLLPAGISALTKDSGQPPSPTGDLPTQDMAVLLEQIDFNYAQPLQGASNLVNNQVKFYFNTTYALNGASPFMTVPTLMQTLGPTGCYRAGVYGDGLPETQNCYPNGFNSTNVCCNAWIEIDQYTCTGDVNFQFSSQPNPYAQSTLLASKSGGGVCDTVPGAPSKKLITNLNDFYLYINSTVCVPTASSNGHQFMVKTTVGGQIGYAPAVPIAACQLSYSDSIQYGPVQTPWKWTTAILSTAYSTFQPTLINYNQILYGRLPGGLYYETVPFVYTPVARDSNGNIIPNAGADPNTCYYAYWTAATDATAPVYAMTPVPGVGVSKRILVNITSQSGVNPTGPGTTYVPNQIDVYDGNGGNVILSNDASNLLPGNIIVVGNLNDQILYDVPSVLLDTSRDATARSGKVTYYLMDVNATSTWPLETWISKYGDIYDPLNAGPNLVQYAYPSINAPDGYPVCDMAGGYPTATELLGVTSPYVCIKGFVRENVSYPVPTQSVGSECSFGTVLYSSASTASFTGFTQTWETTTPYAYMYWFDSKTNAPTSANGFYNAFTVAYSNGNTVKMGLMTGTSSSNVYAYPYIAFNGITAQGKHSLTDGTQHHITWVINNSAHTATLYVDGYVSQVFTFNIGAWTTSGTTTFTAPTTTGVSFLSRDTAAVTPVEIQRRALCQLSLLNPHCTNNGTAETYVIAHQTNPVNTQQECVASTVLFTTELYESYESTASIASNIFAPNQWSLGFWLRDQVITSGSTVTLFTFNGPHYGVSVQLTNPGNAGTHVSFVINAGGQSSLTYDIGAVLTGAGGWHHILMSNAVGTIQFYLDGVIGNSFVFTFNSNTALTASWVKPNSGNVAFVQYYQQAFNTATIYSEYHCQMSYTTYAPPIGYCRVSASTNQGYCRYSTPCTGNCELLSTVDQPSNTFVSGNTVCDNGYNAPLCLIPCSNYDPTTGVCLGNFVGSATAATGVIPNGEWCLFLRDYQVSTGSTDPDTGRQTIYATPRSWSYTGVITIPQGQIISQIATAVCPTVQLSSTGQGAAVTMTNPSATAAPVQIIQGEALSSGGTDGDPNCFTVNGQGFAAPITTIITLPPLSTYTAVIGVCTNMTLDIQVQNLVNGVLAWADCASYSADFVDASIQTNVNLPSTVQTVINTAVDQISTQQAQVSTQLYTNLLSIMSIMAQAYTSNDAITSLIQTQISGVQNISTSAYNFTSLFSTQFDLASPAYTAAMAAAAANVAAAANDSAIIPSLLAQNQNISVYIAGIIQSQDSLNSQIAANNAALQQLINGYGSVGSGGSGGGISGSTSLGTVLGIVFGVVGGLLVLYLVWFYYNKSQKRKAAQGGVSYIKVGSEANSSLYEREQKERLTRRLYGNYK